MVQLATELDNYPFEESDAYDFLNIFPDEIMRKDVLESFLSMEEKNDFTSPLIPACDICAQNKVSEYLLTEHSLTSYSLYRFPLMNVE